MKIWLNHYKVEKRTKYPVDVKDADGLTALHYAARFNKFKILSHLVIEKPGLYSGFYNMFILCYIIVAIISMNTLNVISLCNVFL